MKEEINIPMNAIVTPNKIIECGLSIFSKKLQLAVTITSEIYDIGLSMTKSEIDTELSKW
jgi:hypothetical protein